MPTTADAVYYLWHLFITLLPVELTTQGLNPTQSSLISFSILLVYTRNSLPRADRHTGDLAPSGSVSELGSVQLEIRDNRPRVTRCNTTFSHLGWRSVLGHRSKLQLGFQTGFWRKSGVSGNVSEGVSGHLVFCNLGSLEGILNHTTVEVHVLGELKLDGESEHHG